ncbi:MAG: SixA phosphatase family protein [Stellaceae bacterium]
MKTLHLLRHAKSSWKDLALDDHERPLSKRGRAAAKDMAKYMERAKIAPDIVLCSTAIRARQTLAPIAKRVKPAQVVLERGIYEVSQRELWTYLRALPEEAQAVLVIGHNPGLHDLALALADGGSRHQLPAPEGKFPTGALATFSIKGSWKGMRPHRARLVSFIQPAHLTSAER